MIRRSLLAEALGSLILFATVIGSGIMAERLAGGNVALALLGTTLATGANRSAIRGFAWAAASGGLSSLTKGLST